MSTAKLESWKTKEERMDPSDERTTVQKRMIESLGGPDTVQYVPLHVHTDASLKDGLGTVSRLVSTAKERGFAALAMTDHGSLANSILFSIECESAGIKPIIGMEAYVDVNGTIGHMTLLADGDTGFQSLVKLDNIGHASDRKRPAFTIEDLIEHNRGIILLTGCVSSPLNNLPYPEAKALASRLKGIFGNRMYAEIMFIGDLDSWSRPLKLAREVGLKIVITNDSHFASKDDAEIHPLLTQMKAGFEYNSTELWLKRPEDIYLRVGDALTKEEFDEACHRTFSIARNIHRVNFKRAPSLPHIDNADDKLATMAAVALDNKGLRSHQYISRTDYELSIIKEMGFSTYFLILKDIIDHARADGVRVGPGRGSGAGSLILFLLDCTSIDPLKYNLPFERFLNPERHGMPDVDTDFDSEHRSLVLEYAAKKWGGKQIAAYAHYSHKTLVHDLSKALHIPQELEKPAADKGPDSDEFLTIIRENPTFGHAYNIISGQIRHKGKHAGGVIITDVEVPIERTAGDVLCAAWVEGDNKELSYAGVVKYDLLGLSALSALSRLERKFGEHAPEPVDDDPVFEIFKTGELAGVFQFAGSPGIRELTLRLQPTVFDDLVAINALYRPGALDVGSTDKYPEWKKHPRLIHPLIDDILAPTYGAIVYQEQVMSIFARIMGGTLGQADLARRVIVKSRPDDPAWVTELEALRDTFLGGCHKQGMKEEESEKLWHEIAAHSRYSFNRAHCVSYSYIAWETAWWKFTHPASFYAEMLNTDPGEAQTYIMEAVRNGVRIVPPHVNISTDEYVADEDAKTIYVPLSQIKQLSPNAARCIVESRGTGYTSLKDFMTRCPRKIVRAGAREGLWQLGAFEGVDGSPHDLMIKKEVMDIDVTFTSQYKYMSMIIPTKSLLERIHEAKIEGKMLGVITSKERKESKYGPYVVYKLAPEGIFWIRNGTLREYEVGQLVRTTTNGKTGKAKDVQVLTK